MRVVGSCLQHIHPIVSLLYSCCYCLFLSLFPPFIFLLLICYFLLLLLLFVKIDIFACLNNNSKNGNNCAFVPICILFNSASSSSSLEDLLLVLLVSLCLPSNLIFPSISTPPTEHAFFLSRSLSFSWKECFRVN